MVVSLVLMMTLGVAKLNIEVNSEANREDIQRDQKKENKRLIFQLQLEEIENERIALDMLSEQKAIQVAKAIELETKAEAEKLVEKERLAQEKRLVREEQWAKTLEKEEVENKRLVHDSSVEEEVDKHGTQTNIVTTTSGSIPTITAKPDTNTVAQTPTSTPKENNPVAHQTSGFNFNGHHFPLDSFSGGGKVPQETNKVYQWTDKPDHFLIERLSPAGRAITSVGIGTKIVINGSTYTVTNIEQNIPNNDAAVDYLYKHHATITFQTCETTRGANGKSHVRFWYAK